MAAEVLAAELDLDLYQIDLASVVSKYIGETEKNLRRDLRRPPSESGAILLFDEADALFGKRSEVRDSHDRYANLEISYLLQQMEAYRGVAILTTNMRARARPGVHAPHPLRRPVPVPRRRRPGADLAGRLPGARRRVGDLDFDRLAQLSVSGGVIRNIAMHAAFLAADDAERGRRPAHPGRGPHRVRQARQAADGGGNARA